MGSGASNMGAYAPHRVEAAHRHRRRPSVSRCISSLILCGASPSSSRRKVESPSKLLVTSPELGNGERLKDKRKSSDLSLARGAAPADITCTGVSSSRIHMNGNEIPALQTLPCNVGQCLPESGKNIPCISTSNSIGNDSASSSITVQTSVDCPSATEIANFDVEDIYSITPSNSNDLPSHGYGDSSLDGALTGSSSAEAINSNSDDDSSSFFSDSPIAVPLMQNNNLLAIMPSATEFIVSEREQNMQEGSNYVEIDICDVRNYRRSHSRNSAISTDESDYSGSPNSWQHGFSRDFFNSLHGSLGPRGSGTRINNELGWDSRSESWERFHGNLDSTDTPTDIRPRTIHADSSSTEESGSHAVSRVVLLAQTLFEVLDQIHQQPMSLPLSTASNPAPESIVNSLPVKIHRKEKILGCAEDIPQCHICLAAYEEGDKIRVLPCLHEFHMSCVNKWLNEISSVCPLCRGDICKDV